MLFEAERLIANLYLARKAVKEARRIRNEKFSEIGECEYFEVDNGNGSLCCYRWPSQQNKWCDFCLERQPYHDDYRQKSIKSTVALKAVLNFGKKNDLAGASKMCEEWSSEIQAEIDHETKGEIAY